MERNDGGGASRQRHRSTRRQRRVGPGRHLHCTARMGKERGHVVIVNAARCVGASLLQTDNGQSRVVANGDALFLGVGRGLVCHRRRRSCGPRSNGFGRRALVDGGSAVEYRLSGSHHARQMGPGVGTHSGRSDRPDHGEQSRRSEPSLRRGRDKHHRQRKKLSESRSGKKVLPVQRGVVDERC